MSLSTTLDYSNINNSQSTTKHWPSETCGRSKSVSYQHSDCFGFFYSSETDQSLMPRSTPVSRTSSYLHIVMELTSFYYTGFLFDVSKLILNKNLPKLRYKGLVFFILLCEVCGFVTYLSFECEIPGLFVLHSRTKMLKLRKSQTLHQKNPHFWIFL